MFSYIPYSDSQFYPQSSHPRAYAPHAYARALAEERAARKAAAEQEARARFGQYRYQDDDYGHEYHGGYTPRQRAYIEAQRKQQEEERERARLMTEKARRDAETRARREQETRASLEQFLGRRSQGMHESVSSSCLLDQDLGLIPDTQKSRTPSPARPASSSTSQPTSSGPNPVTTPTATTDTQSQPAVSSSPTPEQVDAATKIQSFYRSRKALATISQLEAKFEELKRGFALPDAVDYLSADGEVITLKVDAAIVIPAQSDTAPESTTPARLAFTHTNVPLRKYDEDLNRILAGLDAVQSWGEKKVREKRRGVVRSVELEAARIETIWAEIWRRYVEEDEEDEVNEALVDAPDESTEMTVDTSSAVEPVASDGITEDAYTVIPSTSSPTEETLTVVFPAESEGVEGHSNPPTTSLDLAGSQPAPILDVTKDVPLETSENEAGEDSGSDSDMESGDSDYESAGWISESGSELDQKDDSDNGLGDEQDADFVML